MGLSSTSKGLSQISQGTFVSHDIMEEYRLSAKSLIKGHITSAPQSPHLYNGNNIDTYSIKNVARILTARLNAE